MQSMDFYNSVQSTSLYERSAGPGQGVVGQGRGRGYPVLVLVVGGRVGLPCPVLAWGAGGQGQDRGPGKLTPLHLPLWTDKQTEKNYLPSYFVRGR